MNELKASLKRVQSEMALIQARIEQVEQRKLSDVPPFARLRGSWKGADFTEEEIDSAQVRAKGLPD
ncbi:MAG: hypothetical protein IH863_00565 [Chloroflexi bacterium]|nr:hypothetical protein [Chloroflexota bacterium]